MQISIDGTRSTNESWLLAHRVSAAELPELNDDEQKVAAALAMSPEGYRRSKYAADLTKKQLEGRALRVGQVVEDWLRNHELQAAVRGVWLKTFDGKFRVDVQEGDTVHFIFLSEELIDDLFDSGSKEAFVSFERLLSINFLPLHTAKAS
jgi:hypothetical protein